MVNMDITLRYRAADMDNIAEYSNWVGWSKLVQTTQLLVCSLVKHYKVEVEQAKTNNKPEY